MRRLGVAMTRHACAFCVALQRLAIRRRDVGLIQAADALSSEHYVNDRERIAFATRSCKGGVSGSIAWVPRAVVRLVVLVSTPRSSVRRTTQKP